MTSIDGKGALGSTQEIKSLLTLKWNIGDNEHKNKTNSNYEYQFKSKGTAGKVHCVTSIKVIGLTEKKRENRAVIKS